MRQSSHFLLLCLLLSLMVVASLQDAAFVDGYDQQRRSQLRRLVEDLSLTDPALFTEARYTRHLSQADRHAPFQDHPMAFEHFPSGSLVSPSDSGSRP
ncbi:MAG: hypothetical protein AB2792_10275 [Candidatus Thiodiazotropha sp.]